MKFEPKTGQNKEVLMEDKICFGSLSIPVKIAVVLAWVYGVSVMIYLVAGIFADFLKMWG